MKVKRVETHKRKNSETGLTIKEEKLTVGRIIQMMNVQDMERRVSL